MVFSILGVGAMGAFVQQAALGPMGSRFTVCWGWVRRRMFALGWSGMVLVPDAGVFLLSAGRSILPQKYFLREILCRICRLGGLWRHISSVRPLYSDQLFLSGGILWSAGTGLGHRAAPDLLLDGRAFGNRRLIFSPLGANTLGIYLCHAPLAGLFRLLPLSPVEMLWAGPFASLWIVCLLWQAFRWRGPLYAIRRMERKADEI